MQRPSTDDGEAVALLRGRVCFDMGVLRLLRWCAHDAREETEEAIFNWLKTRWAAKKTAIVHVAAASAMAVGAAGAAVPQRGGDESDVGESIRD